MKIDAGINAEKPLGRLRLPEFSRNGLSGLSTITLSSACLGRWSCISFTGPSCAYVSNLEKANCLDAKQDIEGFSVLAKKHVFLLDKVGDSILDLKIDLLKILKSIDGQKANLKRDSKRHLSITSSLKKNIVEWMVRKKLYHQLFVPALIPPTYVISLIKMIFKNQFLTRYSNSIQKIPQKILGLIASLIYTMSSKKNEIRFIGTLNICKIFH